MKQVNVTVAAKVAEYSLLRCPQHAPEHESTRGSVYVRIGDRLAALAVNVRTRLSPPPHSEADHRPLA
jgi:hypothetical protein